MDFVKMEGLGNDFIVLEGPDEPAASSVVAWCDRRFGIGADGVLVVTPLSSDRIRMRYWNADGATAEMCGNGLRCSAALAVARGWVKGRDLTVETDAGDMPATVLDDGRVRALVGTASIAGPPMELGERQLHLVSVGNPHAVVFVDDPAETPVDILGPRIENDPFFPDRTNVEFVTPRAQHRIDMRIWERGVGETMASGTGAAAAAFAAATYRGVDPPVKVGLPGGELLIDLEGDRAWMTGAGTLVFEGSIA